MSGPLSTFFRCILQLVRYAWLNFFAVVSLAVGIVFIACVPQTREILANLAVDPGELVRVQETRAYHTIFFIIAMAVWGVSLWYSMRVLSSTKFSRDPAPHPLAQRFAAWMNRELPRLSAYAGVVGVAIAASVYLGGAPTADWIVVLAAGVVPVAWGVSRLADWIFAHRLKDAPKPVYPFSVLVIALAAALIAWTAWNSLPGDVYISKPMSSRWSIGLLASSIVATVVGLWLKGRALADWAMFASLAAWIASVASVIVLGSATAGFWLPFVLLAIAALGLWWTDRRRQLHGIAEQDAAEQREQVGRTTHWALALTIVALGVLIVGFTKAPIAFGNRMGTLAILFFAMALWCFFGSYLWVLLPKLKGWPSLAVVPVLWAALLGNTPDHSLHETSFARAAPAGVRERPLLREHFDAWIARLPRKDASPVFFVAAAGGGLRAGFWTANLLAAVDDATCGEFGRHVYAYSGVSGGSLGLAAYVAQRRLWAEKSEEERCKPGRKEEMTRLLGRDFLAPVAGSMVFAEAFQRFVPLYSFLENERGATLAVAWSEAWKETFRDAAPPRFDEPFLQALPATIPQDANVPVPPAVYLNATGVDSGRRALAANVSARIAGTDDLFRPSRDVPLKTHGLPLREAVLNSARFTYVSPAGTVLGCYDELGADGRCPRGKEKIWDRVVDGGYFENSGLATLTDVIALLGADEPASNRKFKNPVFVIIIDNSSNGELACDSPPPVFDLRHPVAPAPRQNLRRRPQASAKQDEVEQRAETLPPMAGVTAPVEAFLSVREARGRLEVRRLRADFDCPYVLDWSLFGDEKEKGKAAQDRNQPALGWFVSTRSANWMLERADELAGALPFVLAACDDGKKPTRGLLGAPTLKRACWSTATP
jgi:hypothetical protein